MDFLGFHRWDRSMVAGGVHSAATVADDGLKVEDDRGNDDDISEDSFLVGLVINPSLTLPLPEIIMASKHDHLRKAFGLALEQHKLLMPANEGKHSAIKNLRAANGKLQDENMNLRASIIRVKYLQDVETNPESTSMRSWQAHASLKQEDPRKVLIRGNQRIKRIAEEDVPKVGRDIGACLVWEFA